MIGGDSEDDTRGNVLCAAIVDHETNRVETFRDMAQARSFFMSSKPRSKFAFHNLGYDLNNLFGESRFRGLQLTMNGAGILYARAGSRRFLDSSRHFGARLSAMGHAVGIEKMDYDFLAAKREGGIRWSPYLEEYCVNDARIVASFLSRLEAIYGSLGVTIGSTGASTALRLWRAKHAGDLPEKRLPRSLLDYLFEGYFGGRTEAFYIGRSSSKLRYYDVNSMYPFVMKGEFAYPFAWKPWPKLSEHGMTEATVDVPRDVFPPLPYRLGEKVIFPVGRFRGVWTNLEIEFARSKGVRLVRIHSGVHFEGGCSPFVSYVEDLYARRLAASEETDRLAFKILMNSLYGKFAQRDAPQIYGNVNDPPPAGAKTGYVAGEIVCYPMPHLGYPRHANVIWSAEVTAKARIVLYEAMEKLIGNGSSVYYCDTDSVMTNGTLPEGTGLGEWKKEYEVEESEIQAPKAYRFRDDSGRWHVKAKGVPNRSTLGTEEVTPSIAFLDGGKARYEAPMKLREALARHEIEKLNVWTVREKIRKTRYDKRDVRPDGWTDPIALGA